MNPIHILTLHWNKVETIKKLKDSLIPALEGLNWTWHIRDNNSQDDSPKEIKSWDISNINLIEYKDNRGNYAQGMNFLLDQAKPGDRDFVMTLNNDIIVNDALSIKKMISLMERDDSIGQVGAKLNYTDRPGHIQHCGVLFHLANRLPFHHRAGLAEEEIDRKNRIYPAITGAVSLSRGEILTAARHDEKYCWAFEDVDVSMQIGVNLKKQVVYCGETSFLHEESASLKTNPVNRMFLGHNAKHFTNKWRRYVRIDHNSEYNNNQEYNLYKGPQ